MDTKSCGQNRTGLELLPNLSYDEGGKYIALGRSGLALGLAEFPRTKSPKDNPIIKVNLFIALYRRVEIPLLKTNL